MKCPHCLISIHEQWTVAGPFTHDAEGNWAVRYQKCPACKRSIITLASVGNGNVVIFENLVRPKVSSRAPVPNSVPKELAVDYREASLVLADSPKASAGLSRRVLQHLLREVAGFKAKNLDTEIQQAIDSKTLPPYISESLDAVRVIGNFAAHPIKSTSSGEIIDVEPGEAEQQLDTLELLFDFYFEAPARAKAKRDVINAKLQEAGKPLLK